MAAAASLPGFVGEQELNPEGHTTRIFETFQFPSSRSRYDSERSFTFKCRERPTSWSIRLVLERVNRNINCDVTIQRLDSTPVAMGTDLWMSTIPPYPSAVYASPNLSAECLLPNHQRRSLFYFMPHADLNGPGDSPVRLEMFFRIRYCHGDLVGPVGAAYQERYPPPTNFEEMFVNIP